jgi:hypothetical protein
MDLLLRHETSPTRGEAMGPAKLTVNAIQITGFVFEQVHAHGKAQAAREYRSEEVSHFLYPGLFLPKCLIAASMWVFLLNVSFKCGFFDGLLAIHLSFLEFSVGLYHFYVIKTYH